MTLPHKKEGRPSILIADDERGTRDALARFCDRITMSPWPRTARSG